MAARGFTLVDMLAAVAISGVLATLAWPSYRSQLHRAGRSEAIEALQKLQFAQERHRETFGVYAPELKTVGVGGASSGGRYDIAYTATGAESYRAEALPRAGGPQQGDNGCPTLTLEVREGFATLGPDGRCWNR